MAELGGVTINVGINVSNETVQRCCQILQMYLADNPNKTIVVDDGGDGERWVYVTAREGE